MKYQLEDYNIKVGTLKSGSRNAITDVEGVTVGHTTLSNGDIQTGVTAILPHQGNLFREKMIAASHVINGFGKTTGLVQIDEIGLLESPILLTNTLSVGTVQDALVKYMLEQSSEIGDTTGTVNAVVGECNDMVLNNIRQQAVTTDHAMEAIENASVEFEEGAVGAGRGMVCYSLKGGIGSSSRLLEYSHGTYTLGSLVLSNFGYISDLRINGFNLGNRIKDEIIPPEDSKDKGSIMIIIATDLPVSQLQLKRMIKRSVTGLSRTGSTVGNGSGDVVIGFSTAKKIPHKKPEALMNYNNIHDDDIDMAFRAVGDAVEESIINSLICAETVTGRNSVTKHSLREFL